MLCKVFVIIYKQLANRTLTSMRLSAKKPNPNRLFISLIGPIWTSLLFSSPTYSRSPNFLLFVSLNHFSLFLLLYIYESIQFHVKTTNIEKKKLNQFVSYTHCLKSHPIQQMIKKINKSPRCVLVLTDFAFK